jgi:hypothetical protein
MGETVNKLIELANSLNNQKIDLSPLTEIANSIMDFSTRLINLQNFSTLYGATGSLEMFSVSLQNLVNSLPSRNAIGDVLDYVSTSIERLASYSSSATDVIYALSNALSDLNESLEEMNYKSIEKLSKFSGSMMVISLIDETKLNNVLNALAEKKNELSSIVEENNKFTLEKPMNDITSFVQKISDTLTGAPQEAQSPEGTTPEGTTGGSEGTRLMRFPCFNASIASAVFISQGHRNHQAWVSHPFQPSP